MYFDVADLVEPQNYNIKLDESGANLFANAKHCSIKFLGRPRLVNISHVSSKFGAKALREGASTGYGAGFKSPHTFNFRRSY